MPPRRRADPEPDPAPSELVMDDTQSLTRSDLEFIRAMREEFTPARVRYFRRFTDAGMALGILMAIGAGIVAVFGLDRIAHGLMRFLQWMGADK